MRATVLPSPRLLILALFLAAGLVLTVLAVTGHHVAPLLDSMHYHGRHLVQHLAAMHYFGRMHFHG